MDDILNIWNELGKDFEKGKIPVKASNRFDKDKSNLLLARMSRNLRYGLYWNIFFILFLLAASLFHPDDHQILILIGVMLIMYLFTLVYCGGYYLKIAGENIMVENVKTMLMKYHRGVITILRFERITSLFFIPLALIAGVLYSFLLKYGTFDRIVVEPRAAFTTGLLMVTAVPLTILWVSWSQKYAFRSDLKELVKEIQTLSASG
jgi:hypothetical protein